MSAHENFVKDILEHELDIRIGELEKLTKDAVALRNKMTITTSKQLYSVLKSDIDQIDKRRRELRGEISAIRQGIKKVMKED
jgi:predicted  nucleic acid-binding Zn-ribbon protein